MMGAMRPRTAARKDTNIDRSVGHRRGYFNSRLRLTWGRAVAQEMRPKKVAMVNLEKSMWLLSNNCGFESG